MKKYKKNLVLESYSDLLSEEELYDQFDDFINQGGEPVTIFDSTFDLSFILKKCDPIQYNHQFQLYKDWLDQENTVEEEKAVR